MWVPSMITAAVKTAAWKDPAAWQWEKIENKWSLRYGRMFPPESVM